MVFRTASRRSLLPFLVLLSQLLSLVSAKCYNYDGTASTSAFKACNGTGVSMCCQLGASDDNGDVCGSGSTFGLCGVTGSELTRESCTDPTWKDPACLKLCVTGAGAHNGSAITTCDDGSYCCGQNNSSCCDAGQGLFIVKNQLATGLPTVTASISTVTPSPTSTVSSSPTGTSISHATEDPTFIVSTTTPAPQSSTAANGGTTTVAVIVQSSTQLSTGAKVGLGLGIPILVFAIFGIGFYFVRRYWQRKLQQYRQKEQAGADTVTILPGECPSRPNTGHTGHRASASISASMSASIKTAGDFGVLGGDVPEIPRRFGGDKVSSTVPGVFGSKLYSGTWPYHGDKKEAFQMHTYAIEIGDSVPDKQVSPITPHVAEMDAHEPRANNEGVFELGLPSPRLPVEMAREKQESGAEPKSDSNTETPPSTVKPIVEPTVEPAETAIESTDVTPVQKPKGDLSTLPSQRRGTSWLKIKTPPSEKADDMWKIDLGLTTLFKSGAEESKPISKEKEPTKMEAEDKIYHQDPMEEKESILALEQAVVAAAQTDPPPEKERSRPAVRAISVSTTSIPMSQFSPSSSPSRMLHILNEDMMSSSGRAIQRARSEAKNNAPSVKNGEAEDTEGCNSRPVSRGRAHISSMVVDAKVITRPRKKSTSSLKSIKSLKSTTETEDEDFRNLLQVLEYKQEAVDSGLKSPVEMP